MSQRGWLREKTSLEVHLLERNVPASLFWNSHCFNDVNISSKQPLSVTESTLKQLINQGCLEREEPACGSTFLGAEEWLSLTHRQQTPLQKLKAEASFQRSHGQKPDGNP